MSALAAICGYVGLSAANFYLQAASVTFALMGVGTNLLKSAFKNASSKGGWHLVMNVTKKKVYQAYGIASGYKTY